MAVEVFDELPTRGGGTTKRKSIWVSRASLAADHPTKWVVVGDYKSAQSAGAAASGFNRDHKQVEGYEGEFRAASRTLVEDEDTTRYIVLIQYTPEDEDGTYTLSGDGEEEFTADDREREEAMERIFHEVLDTEDEETQ